MTTSLTFFITCHVSLEGNSDIWFLYSGCSNQMTGNKSLFASLNNFVKIEAKLGDDKVVDVVGKGIVNVLNK